MNKRAIIYAMPLLLLSLYLVEMLILKGPL